VHDYLNEAGGAERVLRVLSEMYPKAPIYTSFVKKGSAREMFNDRKIVESKWGWLLKQGRMYSYLRFLLPIVWKSIDLSEYDLVITSSSGYIARGFKVGEKTRVVAYCHTPPKWLYGYETPTGGQHKWWGKLYLTVFGPFVRYFDFQSAQRVDKWMANSEEVKKRVAKFYRQEATVVYPPAYKEESGRNKVEQGDYYLTVARVVGAKGLKEAARAAREHKRRLVVVGEWIGGKMVREEIESAGGEWVEMKGRVSEEELGRLYQGARGYLALARDEDFGMTVIEAMGYGVPIVALRSGGYKETVKEGVTGVLIDDIEVGAVVEGMNKLETSKWQSEEIVRWASKFNRAQFEKKVREVVGK
ncbi:MAG: glycosyltransferase, partial [bacterium]